ncbi:MAG: histidine kinase dimerization/phospho-acceptor domain-containing protein, partial [Candidatus Cryptobacteroides sp.]|nr:histidine kinase dimerization/phospho-acceptor domain-containing protein [Candidatus Cryptobacteroides sp.]
MRFRKSYLLPLLAIISLAAIAAYELYWIKGLYKTRREAAVSEIRVSITWAEMEELTARRKQSSDSVHFSAQVYSGSDVRLSKIVTTQFASPGDSIPEAITVAKVDKPFEADFLRETAGKTNLPLMDSILTHRLDSLGYPLEHRILLMDGEEVLAEAQTPAYISSSRDEHISMTSIANRGAGYELYCEPMTGSILRGMIGVLLMSAGILLILALVFYLMVRALRKQRELDEMKSDFTSNMTHELKTPIAVAYAANDAMLVYGLDKNPEKREEYLKVTRESLEKLNGMVEQILSMSMENRDRLSLRIERTEWLPLLESVAAQTRLSAGKPCDIKVEVSPESLSADIDAALMSSVLATILDNAVKYSIDHADIRIAAEEKDGR